ncbi:MAG: DUF1501 domain-containing protein [Alphaproteobacteria bacterium]|nr:DUF1501 domain-containing protein [Alphaproteobacteria bacterium]
MDRRTFLRLTAASGLAATAPWPARRALAADPYPGPYWLFFHASGGWDPTLLCDPKGRRNEQEVDPVNTYFTDEIEEVGPFKVPPVDGMRAFFSRFRDQLLVINGVDTQTNSHETGTRHTWSGSMDPGMPALGALLGTHVEPRPSLSYLAHGGYDVTDGLVAPTRLADTSAILEIAYPERLDPSKEESTFLPDSLMARLAQARNDRLQRLHDGATLPRVARSRELLALSRSGDNELARLATRLPSSLPNDGLQRQAQVSLACFEAGVAVAASLSTGGFDTHGNHDASHTPRLQTLVNGITYAMDEAERRGIADKVIVVVGSDFARTPYYNDGNGKDHWSITSMMMMGPGIRGGRVVGATDERQVPLRLDPETLQLRDGGVRITPADVHASLRQLAGMDAWDVAARYPVGSLLPLLG